MYDTGFMARRWTPGTGSLVNIEYSIRDQGIGIAVDNEDESGSFSHRKVVTDRGVNRLSEIEGGERQGATWKIFSGRLTVLYRPLSSASLRPG